MLILQLAILGVVVGANNLAASLALGAIVPWRQRWRIVLAFGACEFLLPLGGVWLGQQAATLLEQAARPVAALGLAVLGAWMLSAALRTGRDQKKIARWLTRPGGLVLLGLLLGAENVVVGFSLGLIGAQALLVASVVAAFSMAFTWLGLWAGALSRYRWERYTEPGAGLLLLGLAAGPRGRAGARS